MTTRTLRYSVGNENSPTDPWGRSELVIRPDGSTRLDHHFSRFGGDRGWTGVVTAPVLEALWAALDGSGFPAAPAGPFVPDSTLARLAVDDTSALVIASASGYAALFDVLNGVIRDLSGGAVPYPSRQGVTVTDVRAG